MIKLVTIDLDGTLFDKSKKISDLNKEAISKARALGCKIVIATGRPMSGAMAVLEELGLTTNDDYAIIYNGAKVFNVGTKEVIFSSTINGKDVKELFNESKRLGVYFHAFRKNEDLITNVHNPYTDIEVRLNHIEDLIVDFNDINDDDEFLKAMMVDCDELVTRCINEINPIYPNKYSMVRSAKVFLEFLNKSTDKGSALVALANYLNIDIKDTMAIGDAGNDLSMIVKAGLGVGMKNSFPEILEACDCLTDDNENSGVGKAIYKYVIQNC